MVEHRYLSKLLEVAVVCARLAGQRAMEELNYIKYTLKTDDELVTEADSTCQRIIIERVKEQFPDHGFIAEEGKDGGIFKQPPRGDEKIWWVIDPIDGTNNFAHRLLNFSVSIAVMHEGAPIVGVVFDPATESMFTAVRDGEAQLNSSKIQASDEELSRFVSIGLDSHFRDGVTKGIMEIMTKTRYRNLGTTAMHLAYVANGGLVGCITPTAKLWDVAAGIFIAQTAGAIVTDFQGKDVLPVDLDNYDGGQMPVIAASRKTHAEILRLANLK